MKNIRNFSIIAHIDHGKSTLADRFIEITKLVPNRQMKEQFMDKMELERERGITIKAKAVRMNYVSLQDGKKYVLNLIDTPGHVDFSYEVSRALAACEGALLLVDASQGVEAQTLAHAHMAQKLGLKILPVINKIDLEHADSDSTEEQIWEILREPVPAFRISAKNGEGAQELLERIIREIPGPKGDENKPLRALIFDSFYDSYRGVVIFARVVDGVIFPGMDISFYSTRASYKVEETGIFSPDLTRTEKISAGEVGYIIAGIKNTHEIKMGDTIFRKFVNVKPLEGYEEVKPVVFAGFFPVSGSDYPLLKTAIEKLSLTDSSFTWQGETSKALGFGFRLGFMGILHMDIIRERLQREFGISLIVTSPNVVYRVLVKNSTKKILVTNPSQFPHYGDILNVEEPVVKASILTPLKFMEGVLNLLKEKRGKHVKIDYISSSRVIIEYRLPLNEVIMDFYDRLKSVSRGYASFDYEFEEYCSSDMVKIDVLLHGEVVDALSFIVHDSRKHSMAKFICERLKKVIPRHLFEVAVQARVKGRIIARETVPAARKDVIAKCYGGDVTRKRKLLQKQKEGKKKMKMLGSVELPNEAFMSILRVNEK